MKNLSAGQRLIAAMCVLLVGWSGTVFCWAAAEAGSTFPPDRWPSLAQLRDKWAKVSVEDIERAAENGDPTAQHYLGFCYSNSERVGKNADLALKWYQRAYQQGYFPSANNMGVMYQQGNGVPKDHARAFQYFHVAAENGLDQAMANLGLCYHDGLGVPVDYEEALKWSRRAADRGHAGAMVSVGRAYRFGQGVTRDLSEAMKWFRLGSERGELLGTLNMAMAYEEETSLADEAEAFRLYRQLAGQGVREGTYKVALCYQRGIGVDENQAEALKWLVKAAEAGLPHAQCDLGYYYEARIGRTMTSYHAVSNNMPEAVKWYQRAADQDFPRGKHLLGLCYTTGKGVDWDEERGLELIREAADQGFEFSMVELANLYARDLGEPRDENDRPLPLLIRAAGLQSRDAFDALVSRCKEGLGVERDLVLAAEWHWRAALAGVDGFPVTDKILTPADEKSISFDVFARTLSLYLRAVQRRDGNAMFEIGNLYLTGRNVPRAPDQAWAWLKLASDNGSGKAGELLATVEKAMSPEQVKAGGTRAAELADHVRLASRRGATR